MPNYTTPYHIEDAVDPYYGNDQKINISYLYQCADCGALVTDCYIHDRWHDDVAKIVVGEPDA